MKEKNVRKNETVSGQGTADGEEISLKYENKKQVAKGGLLGFFIGLAIIVPGVSGAAVSIIFGLYEKLLYAMGNVFKKFKKCILFLLPIILGGIIGIVGGFFGVKQLLNLFPFAVVALFAGLMFGSFPAITDQIDDKTRTPGRNVLFAVGVLIPVVASLISVLIGFSDRSLENLKFYHYIIFVVLGYAVAITQIVPGLSATALLMIFGYFMPLMNSVGLGLLHNLPVLLVFVCLLVGFVAGLLTFSKLLSGIIDKHRTGAFNLIAGLSLGAAATMFFNPEIYSVYIGWASGGVPVAELVCGIVLFVAGIALSYKLVKYERSKNVK